MEKIQQFLADNPVWGGVFITVVGITLLMASVYDWNWLFGDINPITYNTRKIDGLVNLFGRRTARIACGILAVLTIMGGLVWIWLSIRK
jgi:hypothetical protein